MRRPPYSPPPPEPCRTVLSPMAHRVRDDMTALSQRHIFFIRFPGLLFLCLQPARQLYAQQILYTLCFKRIQKFDFLDILYV